MPPLLRWFLRLGPTNPIAVRLVQNGSRRARHLYIRSGYLAALIIVLLWTLLLAAGGGSMSYRDLAQKGAQSFEWVAYLQIGLICILAPVFMAGAIAQEANPRTWEVLLTTPLGALEIVLGNLLGRLFFILALLFSSLPLFAITQYFGGVPGGSIFASYAIAGCAALLVGSIAIALSVSRLVGKRAVFAFYVGVVSYLAVTIGVDYWLRTVGGRGAGPKGAGVTWMTAINPFLALRSLLNPSGYPTAEPTPNSTALLSTWFLQHPIATWCVGCLLISAALVIASTFTVRLGGLSTLVGRESESAVPWYRKLFGLGAKGAEHRPPRAVWNNPIAWREAAARNATLGRMISRWAFIALGGLWGLGLIALYFGGSMTAGEFQLALLTTVLAELAVTALVAVNMAATAISREREDGTLDLLLTTPITPGNYLSGKLRGLIAYLLPLLAVPIGTLAAAGIYTLIGELNGDKSVIVSATITTPPTPAPMVLPEAGLVAALVAIPFIAFCAIIGLQWSLKSKGTLGSVVGTVGVAGAISGIIGLCGWNAGSSVPMVGPILSAMSPASVAYALIHPVDAMTQTVESAQLSGARIALLVGAAIAAAVYAGVVYALHASMVKNFDMTVRRLAGVR
jgi:ABC-type transport system involved in multi-copper enzyme maturation permease subunit